MHEQTRRLLMWAEHAERWEPVCAIVPKCKSKIGFIFTSNLPTKTTTVQVDASAYADLRRNEKEQKK